MDLCAVGQEQRSIEKRLLSAVEWRIGARLYVRNIGRPDPPEAWSAVSRTRKQDYAIDFRLICHTGIAENGFPRNQEPCVRIVHIIFKIFAGEAARMWVQPRRGRSDTTIFHVESLLACVRGF